jgi:hypothetical protein
MRQLEALAKEPVWPPAPVPAAWRSRTLHLGLPDANPESRSPHYRDHWSLHDVIEALRGQGLIVLSDHHSRPRTRFDLRQAPLPKILESISRVYGMDWKFDGEVLLLRRKLWVHWDRCEVPNRLLRRWEEMRSRQAPEAAPDLEMLQEMVAELSEDQLAHGLFWAAPAPEGFSREAQEIDRVKPFLRFYATLAPPQRARLRNNGLALGELSAVQLEMLRKAGLWPGARGIVTRQVRGPGGGLQNLFSYY